MCVCCVLVLQGRACDPGPAGPLPAHLRDQAAGRDGEESPEGQAVRASRLPGTRTQKSHDPIRPLPVSPNQLPLTCFKRERMQKRNQNSFVLLLPVTPFRSSRPLVFAVCLSVC